MGKGGFVFLSTIVFSVVGVNGCGSSTSSDTSTDAATSDLCSVDPCGGQLVGTWKVKEACYPGDALANMQAAVSQPACQDLFRGAKIGVSGAVEFQNTGKTVSTAAILVDWSLLVTDACAAELTGQPNLKTSTEYCNTYAANAPLLPGHPFASATCQHVTGGCDCIAKSIYGEKTEGTFRIRTATSEFVDQDGKLFPYCAANGKLSFQAQDSSGLPGYVMKLERQ